MLIKYLHLIVTKTKTFSINLMNIKKKLKQKMEQKVNKMLLDLKIPHNQMKIVM